MSNNHYQGLSSIEGYWLGLLLFYNVNRQESFRKGLQYKLLHNRCISIKILSQNATKVGLRIPQYCSRNTPHTSGHYKQFLAKKIPWPIKNTIGTCTNDGWMDNDDRLCMGLNGKNHKNVSRWSQILPNSNYIYCITLSFQLLTMGIHQILLFDWSSSLGSELFSQISQKYNPFPLIWVAKEATAKNADSHTCNTKFRRMHYSLSLSQGSVYEILQFEH